MKNRILQFGEGNFLRCFIDWMVQRMNERTGFDSTVRIIQPIGTELSSASRALNGRGGRYHTCLRGISGGETVEEIGEVNCVSGVSTSDEIERHAVEPDLRFVFSNTTEAGIQHVKGADTFPAKVLRLARARCRAGLGGLVFIPCELIENNGRELKSCVLQHAADEGDSETADWIGSECVFCSTLVDRIVAGRPEPEAAARYAAELGERDEALVCGEPFHFFVIETPEGFDLEAELPLKAAGLNVVYTADMRPYRVRKVRFLNATHTTMVYPALERGFTEVAGAMADPEFGAFVHRVIFDEIFPTVDLPEAEKIEYARSVVERFSNPFAHHRLESIALNTVAKWETRCLPVVIDYHRLRGELPRNMMSGYEAMARHYDGAGV
ncbi:MAG: tagaturonate reductase [Kiritimatiellae bacterium]|nr:tagaturonate reductase [Kiritimatiellia bacterium]